MFSILVLVLIGALAVIAAIASVVFFLRAREREESGTESAGTAGLSEMRALGQRIESLVGQQQIQGETARQHLAQKIDAVGESVDQQRHHVSGLQNELRHEVRRREAEMDEIRTQITSIQQTAALGPASAPRALPPPAGTAAPAPVDTGLTDVPAFHAEPFHAEPFPAEPFPAEPFLAEPSPFEAPFAGVATGDGRAAAFGETPTADGWDTGLPAAPSPVPAASIFSDPFAFADPFAAATEPDSDASPFGPVFSAVDPFGADESQPAGAVEADAFLDPATAEASDFEPFDFQPPVEPAASAPSDASLFEDVSFGAASGFAFEDLTASAPQVAETAVAVPIERVTPLPPSQTAWVARTDRQGLDGAAASPFALPAFEAPAFEAPAFEAPAFEAPAFEAPAFEAPAFEAPAFEAPAFEAPFVAPAGADNLTVISTIDETVQRALYLAGVTTLDEIARWNRGDARRIAGVVSVSEDTIMHQWVFEAQAALFHSYSAQQKG